MLVAITFLRCKFDVNIISFFTPFLNPFFFVYCGAKFVSRKALTFGGTRVTIQTTKNSLSTADAVFGEYLFDHSLSHIHARSTRKQWRKKSRKGCVSERKGAEMPRIERKQVL